MRNISFFLLVVLLSCAEASPLEEREVLIDRLNYFCTAGGEDYRSLLQADALQYLSTHQDEGFKNLFETLLFGERGCKANILSRATRQLDAPTVERLSIPPINVNEMVRLSHVVASSSHGISSIYIYGQNATSFSGYAYITLDANPTFINMTFAFISEFYVGEGFFNITVVITDKDGVTTMFTYQDLIRLGLQSNIVYAVGGCNAGYFKGFNSTQACKPCPTGSYSKKDAFTCAYCPSGQGPVGSPSTSCEVCPAGSFSTGMAKCRTCPAGSYSSIGSYACTLCASGSYSSAGASYCTPCSPGTAAKIAGQSSCTPCLPGTYAISGSSECTQCRPGTYSAEANAPSSISCKLCPEGTYSSVIGSRICTNCPYGYISPEGSTNAFKCFEM